MSQRTVLKIRCDRCGHVEEVDYRLEYPGLGTEASNLGCVGPRPTPPSRWGSVGDSFGRKDLCPACADDYAIFMKRTPKEHEYHVKCFIDKVESLDIQTTEGLLLKLVLPPELRSTFKGVHNS